jgi:beta-lactamase superfamily II metal-dependent hydrolase
LYPDCLANVTAKNGNNTCAVIALFVGTQKIIFSGDTPVDAWKLITGNNEQVLVDRKLSVQILTVPHHGGKFADNDADTAWFFDHVKSEYAIISVGCNSYGHPLPMVIQSFVKNGSDIFCTQSTNCCNNITGQCCGTIIADISPSKIAIKNIDGLRRVKEQFPSRLCK